MANNSDDAIDFSKTLLGKDPIGPLSKLLWECQSIHTAGDINPLVRMFMSLNAASTAWHLAEWTWKRCPPGQQVALIAAVKASKESWPEYANAIRKSNIDIAICRQLATAGKHVTVSHDEMKNLSVQIEHNDETNETLIWICLDDQRIPDIDVYARALRWWIELYIHIGFPEAQRLAEAFDQSMSP